MGRRPGRTDPCPRLGSCDPDVLRPSEIEHPVQDIGGNGHLGRLPPICLRTQSVADDAFPARDIGLHQSTPVVPRGPLPTHAAALGNTSQIASRWVGAVSVAPLGTALERGGTTTTASGCRAM